MQANVVEPMMNGARRRVRSERIATMIVRMNPKA